MKMVKDFILNIFTNMHLNAYFILEEAMFFFKLGIVCMLLLPLIVVL